MFNRVSEVSMLSMLVIIKTNGDGDKISSKSRSMGVIHCMSKLCVSPSSPYPEAGRELSRSGLIYSWGSKTLGKQYSYFRKHYFYKIPLCLQRNIWS